LPRHGEPADALLLRLSLLQGKPGLADLGTVGHRLRPLRRRTRSVMETLVTLCRLVTDDPWTYYWRPGLASLGVLVALAFTPIAPSRIVARVRRPWIFAVACAVVMILLRWPTFFAVHQYNVDEQLLAGNALALLKNRSLGLFLDGAT